MTTYAIFSNFLFIFVLSKIYEANYSSCYKVKHSHIDVIMIDSIRTRFHDDQRTWNGEVCPS